MTCVRMEVSTPLLSTCCGAADPDKRQITSGAARSKPSGRMVRAIKELCRHARGQVPCH